MHVFFVHKTLFYLYALHFWAQYILKWLCYTVYTYVRDSEPQILIYSESILKQNSLVLICIYFEILSAYFWRDILMQCHSKPTLPTYIYLPPHHPFITILLFLMNKATINFELYVLLDAATTFTIKRCGYLFLVPRLPPIM